MSRYFSSNKTKKVTETAPKKENKISNLTVGDSDPISNHNTEFYYNKCRKVLYVYCQTGWNEICKKEEPKVTEHILYGDGSDIEFHHGIDVIGKKVVVISLNNTLLDVSGEIVILGKKDTATLVCHENLGWFIMNIYRQCVSPRAVLISSGCEFKLKNGISVYKSWNNSQSDNFTAKPSKGVITTNYTRKIKISIRIEIVEADLRETSIFLILLSDNVEIFRGPEISELGIINFVSYHYPTPSILEENISVGFDSILSENKVTLGIKEFNFEVDGLS